MSFDYKIPKSSFTDEEIKFKLFETLNKNKDLAEIYAILFKENPSSLLEVTEAICKRNVSLVSDRSIFRKLKFLMVLGIVEVVSVSDAFMFLEENPEMDKDSTTIKIINKFKEKVRNVPVQFRQGHMKTNFYTISEFGKNKDLIKHVVENILKWK